MTVGQKVVCVDDKFPAWLAKFYKAFPVKDVVYVIRNMQVGISPEGTEGEVCLYLIGLNNPPSTVAPFRERGFNAERFRPLVDETDKIAKEQEAGDLVGVEVATSNVLQLQE